MQSVCRLRIPIPTHKLALFMSPFCQGCEFVLAWATAPARSFSREPDKGVRSLSLELILEPLLV